MSLFNQIAELLLFIADFLIADVLASIFPPPFKLTPIIIIAEPLTPLYSDFGCVNRINLTGKGLYQESLGDYVT